MNTVVFDEAHKWSHWLYPWLTGGVVRLFVGFLLLRYARREWVGWFAWLVCVMVWAGSGGRVSEHLAIQHALASGSYSVVDGTVENFHPMPHHGHTLERFEGGESDFSTPISWTRSASTTPPRTEDRFGRA